MFCRQWSVSDMFRLITVFTYLLHADDADEHVAAEWRQLQVFISVAMDTGDHVTTLPRDAVLKV